MGQRTVAKSGLLLEVPAGNSPANKSLPATVAMPKLPTFNTRYWTRRMVRRTCAGFSLDVWLQLEYIAAGQVLLDDDSRSARHRSHHNRQGHAAAYTLNDGRQAAAWDSDQGVLVAGEPQHVVITVDGGPKIVTFVVNGVLCDGSDERQFGWGRLHPDAAHTAGCGGNEDRSRREVTSHLRPAPANKRSRRQLSGGSDSMTEAPATRIRYRVVGAVLALAVIMYPHTPLAEEPWHGTRHRTNGTVQQPCRRGQSCCGKCLSPLYLASSCVPLVTRATAGAPGRKR